ncbi:molybdenum ABC transporter ATP-binding protein [Marinomonas epiphytica]
MSQDFSLEIDVHRKYANSTFELRTKISLTQPGVTALFGSSGSGKTSLLRAIAGLDKEVTGRIQFRDTTWLGSNTRVAPHKRPVGYVFQEASLFEHLSVADNLKFAMKRAPKPTDSQQYSGIISLLKIGNLLQQAPKQLSGGERQRVALARSLLIQPELLLLDEPLSALDDKLKQEIMPYLEALCHHTQLPILYVTHSLDEVCRLADQICLLEQGVLIEQGDTGSVLAKLNHYDQYQNTSALIRSRIDYQDEHWGLCGISIAGQPIVFKAGEQKMGDEVRLRLPAKDISISLHKDPESSIINQLSAQITHIQAHPMDIASMILTLKVGDAELFAQVTRFSVHQLSLTTGMHVIAQIKSAAIVG